MHGGCAVQQIEGVVYKMGEGDTHTKMAWRSQVNELQSALQVFLLFRLFEP